MGQKHRLSQSFIVAVMSVFLLIAVYLTAVVLLPMAGKKEEQETDPKKAAKKGTKAKNTPQPPQDAPEPDEKDLPF